MDIYDYTDNKRHSLNRTVDFTTGVNPLGPSNKAKNAIRKQVRHIDLFPDVKIRHLKRYLCKVEGVEENQILFGPGSTHLLRVILQIMRPRTVAVLSPMSARLEQLLRESGATIKPLPLEREDGYFTDVERVLGSVHEWDILILSRPHDMTGSMIDDGDLARIMEETERLGKILVIDEAYRDYTSMKSPVALAASSQSMLILRTFSLFHGLAGLRLGYGIGAPKLIAMLDATRPSLQINALAPHAGLASLRDKGFRMRSLKFIEDEKAYLTQKASLLKGVRLIDTPYNFVLLDIDRDLEDLKKAFLERDILVDGFVEGEGRVYLRLPVGRRKANAWFMRTLRRIAGGKE